MPNFEFISGSITSLPFNNNEISTVSCLHTIEHIGLGRYGDEIDPDGMVKAFKELMRVIKPGGDLILSLPVGDARVEFNGQRISNPLKPIELLSEMELIEFSAIDDAGVYIKNTEPQKYLLAKCACGLYHFRKK